jgi:hypothetical protein
MVLIVSTVVIISTVMAAAPAYAMNTCANLISACPCAIRSAGDYTIFGSGLVATPPGDCIHVNVPGVTLDLANTTLSSSPPTTSDVGIHVLAGATARWLGGL